MAAEDAPPRACNKLQPKSLYELSVQSYLQSLTYKPRTLDRLFDVTETPVPVLINCLYEMSKMTNLSTMLFTLLADLDVIQTLLQYTPARQQLFQCFGVLVNQGELIDSEVATRFTTLYDNEILLEKAAFYGLQKVFKSDLSLTEDWHKQAELEYEEKETIAEIFRENYDEKDILFGLRLGSFLSELGSLAESAVVLKAVISKLAFQNKKDQHIRFLLLDALQRLLYAETALFSFKTAKFTCKVLHEFLTDDVPADLRASIFTQLSELHFARSEYVESFVWSNKALACLNRTTPEKIIIEALRQTAKSCVVKRQFPRANLMICQAKLRARQLYGETHQKYADTLLDYGFFLINVDSVYQSISVYQQAIDIKRAIFGGRNLHVAVAHVDLSYAYYVHEYNSGNFHLASEHVDKAVNIMRILAPCNHLMLASAKRVKALLLEEIALDSLSSGGNNSKGFDLLIKSEKLHKSALDLSLENFGVINVQTAKHYGNLGRLYQTMNRYEEAENMHHKSIKIKTDLLGNYDYEVGLSIGHLASLYNYQMKKYHEAEKLYLRSIEIGLRLFGPSYSGLEYDYLGLLHVYESLNNAEKYVKYAGILENWQTLRGVNAALDPTYPPITDEYSLDAIKESMKGEASDTVTLKE